MVYIPKKDKRPKNPDYYCHYNNEVTAQWLNRNLATYDVLIDGEYVCTCQVKPDHGRKEVIERFKVMKRAYKNFPEDRIETKLISVV